jgi:hypothetical protein
MRRRGHGPRGPLPVSSQGPVRQAAATAPPLVITAFNGGPMRRLDCTRTPWASPTCRACEQRRRDIRRVTRWRAWRGAAPTGLLNDEQWAARQKQIQQESRRADRSVVPRDFARAPSARLRHRRSPDGIQPQPLPAARTRASATAARSATARSTPSTTSQLRPLHHTRI